MLLFVTLIQKSSGWATPFWVCRPTLYDVKYSTSSSEADVRFTLKAQQESQIFLSRWIFGEDAPDRSFWSDVERPEFEVSKIGISLVQSSWASSYLWGHKSPISTKNARYRWIKMRLYWRASNLRQLREKEKKRESKMNINILERETIETCAIKMGNYMSLDTAKGPKISPKPSPGWSQMNLVKLDPQLVDPR